MEHPVQTPAKHAPCQVLCLRATLPETAPKRVVSIEAPKIPGSLVVRSMALLSYPETASELFAQCSAIGTGSASFAEK